MKKLLLTSLLALGTMAFAQSYCVPQFNYGCDDGDLIDSFEIPSASFSHMGTGCSAGSYGDYTSQTITLSAGLNYPFTVTHDYGSQNVKIWIDLNNDGAFDEVSELVGQATSDYINGANLSQGSISVPATTPVGNYRLRIADRFSSEPIPCNIDGYGEAHDYTVHIALPPSCLPPTNVSSSAITANSATISWSAPTSTVGVGYEYYLDTSNTTPASSTIATGTVAANQTSTNITGLIPTTDYYVWVRSACSATDKSPWSLSTHFTTLCAAVTPAYTNDFTVFPGNCWSTGEGGDVSTGPTSATSYRWSEDGFANNGYTGAGSVNIYSYSSSSLFTAWLISNELNLSGGTYNVSFDYAFLDYGSGTFDTMGSDDEVKLLISNDSGATWSTLHTWNAANPPAGGSATYSLDLVGYNSATTKFALFASNGSVVDSQDFQFYIDNFSVQNSTLATSESTAARKSNISVYPNPFNDEITISDISKVTTISIVDGAGRLIKTIDQPKEHLQLHDLQIGVYLIVLQMKDGSKQTLKAIKK